MSERLAMELICSMHISTVDAHINRCMCAKTPVRCRLLLRRLMEASYDFEGKFLCDIFFVGNETVRDHAPQISNNENQSVLSSI